jgi:hypothetical protein
MRNQDVTLRNPKYLLRLEDIPQEYLLLVRNFNEDSEEFTENIRNIPKLLKK